MPNIIYRPYPVGPAGVIAIDLSDGLHILYDPRHSLKQRLLDISQVLRGDEFTAGPELELVREYARAT